MAQGDVALILVEAGKNLEKDVLGQVLFVSTTRKVGADDLDDERIEVFRQRAGGILVPQPHAVDAVWDVEFVLVHASVVSTSPPVW